MATRTNRHSSTQGLCLLLVAAMLCVSLRPLSAAAQTPERRSTVADYLQVGPGTPACAAEEPSPWIASFVPPRHALGGRCQGPRTPAPPPTVDARYSALLEELREQTKRARLRLQQGRALDAEVAAPRTWAADFAALDEQLEASFQETARELSERGLPPVLLERHQAFVSRFKTRRGEFQQLLRQLDASAGARDAAGRMATLGKLLAFFERHPQGRRTQPLPVDKLPFGAPDGVVRAPATTAAALPAALSRASFRPTASSEAASAEDLAPTEDVQLTPAVQALAASLDHNPVRLYQWVRNHIRWLPTYGSVQGSEVTLLTRRGNAFDTASLLIALYRASGIPARYVYGTLEVPAPQVMNWVGGVTRADVAQQLMSQGGIPSVVMTDATGIRAFRLEHMWVEAFVDFSPSRGALQKSPDTWVPLDAAFKQYDYPAPVDMKAAIPMNVQPFVDRLVSTAQVDATTGSLTGLDPAAYDAWAEELADGINGHFTPDAKLSDVTGPGVLRVLDSGVLASTLPNPIVVRTRGFSKLPDGLRHQLHLSLSESGFYGDVGDPSLTASVSLARLAGKRLGVTYVPATATDAAVLDSYRKGTGHTLPLYLIYVRPVLQLDGVDLVQGAVGTMGQEHRWRVQLIEPGGALGHDHTYLAAAGDELVFGVNGAGITQELIHQRFTQRPSDTAAENLHTIALYYWAQYDVLNEGVAKTQNAVVQRLPSIGLFGAPLQIQYLYGMPRTGYYTSRFMDVSRSIVAAVGKAGGSMTPFHRLSGTLGSLLEGRTFDAVLGRAPGSGVSSIQLLQEANEQRIPLHLITADNHALIAPRLQLDADIEAHIAQAVQAGKVVYVSERAPAHGNWKGAGYIVEDPETGAAAYLIRGGLNGGNDDPCDLEAKKEPVRVPVAEIAFVVAAVLAIILLILFLPEAIAAAGALIAAAGPILARLGAALGLAALSGPVPATASGPRPGDGMEEPGDCSWSVYETLRDAVRRYCHGAPRCQRFDRYKADCDALRSAWQRNLDCANARTVLNNTCFRGGDQKHWDEELIAWERVYTCECRLASNKCPSP